jgi:phosphoglycolate phosphatase
MITAVFFDLDGTLADTAPDLAYALNKVLSEHGRPTLSLEKIRSTVSLGGNAMIQLAFNLDEKAPEFSALRERFLDIYNQKMHSDTHLFPGISEVLTTLEADNITWGVITNKSSWFTQPLMEHLGLEQRTACIVSGDTTDYRKPHPAPMQYACEITQSEPGNSVYIGDAKRDIDAGRAAGMHTLVAQYGYISEDENPLDWKADAMISEANEIISWLRSFSHD